MRGDLAAWQKLNAACFLAGGLVGMHPELSGESYRDASGQVYGPLIRQPVLVFAASGEDLTRVLHRALDRGLKASIYTEALFATGNDTDNRAAVASVPTDKLDLVGLGLYAERREVDKMTKGLSLHE